MEGPTPVSALIHSATMVAAGVFLLIRAFPLFEASETTMQVILVIGSLTALTGAFLATVQRDIKKIMAYSTVSQLGFMVMAIGAGSTVAAMFHLSTHAYFKSLLFLTSGAFIHHFHSNDIWVIGKKGGKKDTLAVVALCVGLFSLCGIPPFSGFFSKDMILETLKEHNLFFFGVAILVSTLTAYYSFRLLFVILFSKIESPKHGHSHDTHEDHAHEPSRLLNACRAIPLIALALTSIYVGFLGTELFGSSLLHWLGGHAEEMHLEMLIITAMIIFTGVVTAFIGFKDPQKAETRLEAKPGPIKAMLLNKFYIDDAYAYFVNNIGLRFAALMNRLDKKVFNQWMVDQSSLSIGAFGRLASRLQSGSLQNYISIALAVFAMLVLVLTIK